MGGLRREVEKLKKKIGSHRWDLRCPECGWEIALYGDVPVDLIVYEWEQGVPRQQRGPSSVPPGVVALCEHDHPAGEFIEKRSGLPLSDPVVSGFGETSAPRLEDGV